MTSITNILVDGLPHDLRDLFDLVIVIAHIVNFLLDFLVGLFQQKKIGGTHILDMKIGPHLLTAKDGDLSFVYGVVGQDVDGQIQAQPGGIAAYRRRSENGDDKPVIRCRQKHLFALRFVFGIIRKGHQGKVLSDFGLILDAVDA